MNARLLNEFVLGLLVMSCAVGGVFFLRFWRKTRDRLFAIFAIAFWLLGLNWFLLAFISLDEAQSAIYVVRLLAFILILIGILDKNRPTRSSGDRRKI
jgi:hypothetical protein